MIRSRAIHYARLSLPPLLWNALMRLKGRTMPQSDTRTMLEFRGHRWPANAKPLYSGRFADLIERYSSLDPHTPIHVKRYRLYNVCKFAELCRNVPGYFICAGVSYGVAPRMVYDFVDFQSTGKTLHLIDAFSGITETGQTADFYNTDMGFVRSQYPANGTVQIHQGLIPDILPLPGRIAFAFLNTGNGKADASSIPILYDSLSPGGAIITDQFAAHIDEYTAIDIEPLWLPSGQAVFFKH